MERGYIHDYKTEEEYTNKGSSNGEILSEEDRMMSEVYLPLVRIIPAYRSWDYQ